MASVRMSRRNNDADVVGECIEKLHEKRRAAREDGVKALVAALEGLVPVDELDYRYFTVFDRCCASLLLRKARLAYRAIGLLALTVDPAPDAGCSKDILDKSLPILEKTLQSSSSSDAAAALECLAAVTLAGARRLEDAAPSMKAVLGVIERTAGEDTSTDLVVLPAAVSAFSVLLTTAGDLLRTCRWGSFREVMIPFGGLAELLESGNPAVRMAAGEVLAVCAELNLTRHASPGDQEALETRVFELAYEAGDNEDQQVLFQKIAAVLSDEECPKPEESMAPPPSSSSGRGVLRTSTLARMVQLNFLKRFLGKGFDKHVQGNPLFREEDSSVAVADELPTEKIRQRDCRTEKQRSSARRMDRDIGWESKNRFPHYD
ncbi:uncharacterized protein LOC104583473 [Brachypodium distachyon]|uniref:Interferon-related developmental regulator N-terminal domain-containing protein n=1 Tax=Brachypodium distachyon TaxID=15368 RepID=A0A0Q3LNH0_BRADI|nr:uncharacterized protein LOC104583473 [Brachypodium distachyon]KQJ94045.1 hypothetical protein BRADI_3g08172v3 [Brachypodium distachyon]|eukprot:XP_014756144.1 uncharacterized protein LOC104583473 [Brachypodium distachyon]